MLRCLGGTLTIQAPLSYFQHTDCDHMYTLACILPLHDQDTLAPFLYSQIHHLWLLIDASLRFSSSRSPALQDMDDSDEEVKMVKWPHHRVRCRIMEDDGDNDLSVDLQPSAESSPAARSATLQSNSAQSIRHGEDLRFCAWGTVLTLQALQCSPLWRCSRFTARGKHLSFFLFNIVCHASHYLFDLPCLACANYEGNKFSK